MDHPAAPSTALIGFTAVLGTCAAFLAGWAACDLSIVLEGNRGGVFFRGRGFELDPDGLPCLFIGAAILAGPTAVPSASWAALAVRRHHGVRAVLLTAFLTAHLTAAPLGWGCGWMVGVATHC